MRTRFLRHLPATAVGAITAMVGLVCCATSPAPAPPTDAHGNEAPNVPDAASPTRLVAGDFISKSRGVEGGLLLLYPRIIPSGSTAAVRGPALALQARLAKLLTDAYPERPVDIRPEGERVCIKSGCLAASVGVLIIVQDTHCVAVVSVTAPGVADHALMPWAGTVSVALSVPFREPLESYVKVGDMVACDRLAEATLEHEDRIRKVLKGLD